MQTTTTEDSTRIGRRTFFKGIAAGSAGAAGVGSMSAPAAADDGDDDDDGGLRFPNPTTAPVYLYQRINDHFSGVDEDELEDAQDDMLVNRFEDIALEIERSNEDVAAPYLNMTEALGNWAFYQTMPIVAESLDDGLEKSEITDNAEDHITDIFLTSEKNLLDRHEVTQERLIYFLSELQDRDLLNTGEYDESKNQITGKPTNPDSSWHDKDGGDDGYLLYSIDYYDSDDSMQEIDLIDGSVRKIPLIWATSADGYSRFARSALLPDDEREDENSRMKMLFNGYKIVDPETINAAYNEVRSIYDDTINEINVFIENIYDEYQDGNVDIDEIVQFGALTGMSSDEDDAPLASATLTNMGVSRADSFALTIELLDDEIIADGRLYLSNTDISRIDVGETYVPDGADGDGIDVEGLIYFTTTEDDEEILVRIEQPFQVLDAFDSDGNAIDDIGFTGPEQDRVDYDVDDLMDEIERIQQEREEIEQDIQDAAGAGGFDWSNLAYGDIPGEAVAAVIAIAGGFVLFGGGGS